MPFCFFYLRVVSGDLYQEIIPLGKLFITILPNGNGTELGFACTKLCVLKKESVKVETNIQRLEH
jgi:hypothetical protein